MFSNLSVPHTPQLQQNVEQEEAEGSNQPPPEDGDDRAPRGCRDYKTSYRDTADIYRHRYVISDARHCDKVAVFGDDDTSSKLLA